MTSQPLGLMRPYTIARKAATRVAVLVVAAAFLAGCDKDGPTDRPTPPAQESAPVAPGSAPPKPEADAPRVAVADLMKVIGCADIAVIATQLHSRETGRCKADAGEITVAAFDSVALRDQWVAAAKQLGGTVVVGLGWALSAARPDDADAAAKKLGGERV